MSDSHSMDPITEMLKREAKREMCFQSTNCIYIIERWEVALGDEERSLIGKHLDEVSKVWMQSGIYKIRLSERNAGREGEREGGGRERVEKEEEKEESGRDREGENGVV